MSEQSNISAKLEQIPKIILKQQSLGAKTMATIRVNTTIDENNKTGNISLREAFIQANGSAGDDTIQIDAGKTYKLTIAGIGEDKSAKGDLDILTGGKITISVIGNGNATIDGSGIDRVLDIQKEGSLRLENVIVKGGKTALSGGGVRILDNGYLELESSNISNNSATGRGGGIDNNIFGRVTIANSTISNNTSANSGGGISNWIGQVTLNNSAIHNNKSTKNGGGISNNIGPVTLTNSTISRNNAGTTGGAINNTGGQVTIRNSTISGNSSITRGSGIYNNRYYKLNGIVNFNNSIVAGNKQNLDIFNNKSTINSTGYNLIGNATGLETVFNKTGDKKGNATTPLNAKLGPLQNNGGKTFTQALLGGSPAINAGNTTIVKDQRGNGRNGKPDIGAYEYQGTLAGDDQPNVLIGSPLADIIDGLGGNDTITGLAGNDKLIGGNGSDSLDGGNGNDTLIGSDGNDTFVSSAGNDILTGGPGGDEFTYNTKVTFTTTSVGVDTITDFSNGQGDKILLGNKTFAISSFTSVTSKPDTTGADLIYNSTTGEVFYDTNGQTAGYGTGGKFLVFPNKPSLGVSDFAILS